MAIAPINSINVRRNYNNSVNFGNRYNEGKEDKYEERHPRRASNMVTVPLAVLMALSPSLSNANQPMNSLQLQEKMDMTELLAAVPSDDYADAADLLAYAPAVPQKRAPYGVAAFIDKNIQLAKPFKDHNGRKQTLIFATYEQEEFSDNVLFMYVLPEGYKGNSPRYTPPEVKSIIYHNIGADKEFCGLVYHEQVVDKAGKVRGYIEREMRVPDDVANEVLALVYGDAKWTNSSGVNLYETKSPKLRSPKIVE